MEDKIRSQFLRGFMSLYNGTLRNFCKHDKIRDIVKARGIEDYEPSYKGLKLSGRFLPRLHSNYEPSYKGLKLVVLRYCCERV